MPAPSSHLERRAGAVRATLAAADLDALLVTHLPNIRYLTNFAGTTAVLVLAREGIWFVTDGRYVTEVGSLLSSGSGPPATTLVRVARTYEETLLDVLRAAGAARVGVEAASLTVKRLRWLEAALTGAGRHTALVSTERAIEQARVRKDGYELDVLRAAACRLSEVACAALDGLRPGPTERQIARRIDELLATAGFERPAFETIVAAGPASALPHARAGDRPLGAGQLVLLDFGGVSDGYCVDLTRTVALGALPPAAERLHGAVLEAQQAALQAVRPSVAASRVDAAARGVLEAAGFGEAFSHSTGHGLGLEVHEEPRIGRRLEPTADQQAGRLPPPPLDLDLAVGMVFTIEPGAYVPGLGGVRIEDDVVVTDAGCEVLTEVPRGLTGKAPGPRPQASGLG
jgi:Xaa-Pro aminopeptidase